MFQMIERGLHCGELLGCCRQPLAHRRPQDTGVLHFREPFTLLKVIGTLAIIGGVVALNITNGH